MTHSDDKGLVVPPKLAPIHAVVLPIWMKDDQVDPMKRAGRELFETLKRNHPDLDLHLDDREQYKPGWKFAEWEQRGTPVRIELGPRDMEKGQVVLARRDTGEKLSVPRDDVGRHLVELLDRMQRDLLARAREFREVHTHRVDDYETFKTKLEEQGGFYLAHWDGTAETEAKVKEETKATIRCIPLDAPDEPGVCMVTGQPSTRRVIWARNY